MVSLARAQQAADAPLRGAMLALLILATCTLIGVSEALGIARPLAIPVAIVIGALLGRWLLRPLYALTLVLMIVAAIGIWSPLTARAARHFVRTDAVDLAQVDAVFVFSNSVTTRGLVKGEGIDRLLAGITLRAQRPGLPLVVSVVRHNERRGISSLPDQQALIALVPARGPVESIDSVYSTRDEALKLTRRAFQARWKRVAVVTSPMHTRRACATVEALGLAVTCVAAPWRVASVPPRTSGDRLVVMQRIVYESLAWVQYIVSGWASWS
ncbi:MAG TPA: ElyC/SanA/YdcF family protein [Gemmatimonadaceae bacterium]|nr:ElyC/SanA/YdcF family protein [Gemmatimonadaceae bacterium]